MTSARPQYACPFVSQGCTYTVINFNHMSPHLGGKDHEQADPALLAFYQEELGSDKRAREFMGPFEKVKSLKSDGEFHCRIADCPERFKTKSNRHILRHYESKHRDVALRSSIVEFQRDYQADLERLRQHRTLSLERRRGLGERVILSTPPSEARMANVQSRTPAGSTQAANPPSVYMAPTSFSMQSGAFTMARVAPATQYGGAAQVPVPASNRGHRGQHRTGVGYTSLPRSAGQNHRLESTSLPGAMGGGARRTPSHAHTSRRMPYMAAPDPQRPRTFCYNCLIWDDRLHFNQHGYSCVHVPAT